MKKLLTLICLSLIVSASVESKQSEAKFNYCFLDGNGVRVCCTPFGFCYPAPKPPPADPIIIEQVNPNP